MVGQSVPWTLVIVSPADVDVAQQTSLHPHPNPTVGTSQRHPRQHHQSCNVPSSVPREVTTGAPDGDDDDDDDGDYVS